ncbi:unnamed protein product [Effrenium voratum]|nr:unnamed protein product [Effrenium voratum]
MAESILGREVTYTSSTGGKVTLKVISQRCDGAVQAAVSELQYAENLAWIPKTRYELSSKDEGAPLDQQSRPTKRVRDLSEPNEPWVSFTTHEDS